MSEHDLTIRDRLEDILESIGLIEEWSQGMTELHDFMISPGRVMAFNACVMRLQVIGEHVGKLLKEKTSLLRAIQGFLGKPFTECAISFLMSTVMLMRQLWFLSSMKIYLSLRP